MLDILGNYIVDKKLHPAFSAFREACHGSFVKAENFYDLKLEVANKMMIFDKGYKKMSE